MRRSIDCDIFHRSSHGRNLDVVRLLHDLHHRGVDPRHRGKMPQKERGLTIKFSSSSWLNSRFPEWLDK